MQVICIDDNFKTDCPCEECRRINLVPFPILGETYTVKQTHLRYGMAYRELIEVQTENAYAADHFAEINGPDEIEMAKEREQKAIDRAKKLQPIGLIVALLILIIISL